MSGRETALPAIVGLALRVTAFLLPIAVWMAVAVPSAQPSAGGSSCAERVQQRLYFGLAGTAGLVTDADWDAFVTNEITVRFPAGLTVMSASGQWRGPDRQVMREPARVVEIVHEASPSRDRDVAEIVAIYKRRFEQDSVMVARARIDVCF